MLHNFFLYLKPSFSGDDVVLSPTSGRDGLVLFTSNGGVPPSGVGDDMVLVVECGVPLAGVGDGVVPLVGAPAGVEKLGEPPAPGKIPGVPSASDKSSGNTPASGKSLDVILVPAMASTSSLVVKSRTTIALT